MLTVQDIMTTDLTMLPVTAPIHQAARMMRDHDIGDVIVIDSHGAIVGLVTDRDLTVRAIADGLDPDDTEVGDVCTTDLVVAHPDQEVDDVIHLMQEKAVRRIPVIEGDRAVGIVSLGDLALEQDPSSTLAQISGALPSA